MANGLPTSSFAGIALLPAERASGQELRVLGELPSGPSGGPLTAQGTQRDVTTTVRDSVRCVRGFH